MGYRDGVWLFYGILFVFWRGVGVWIWDMVGFGPLVVLGFVVSGVLCV